MKVLQERLEQLLRSYDGQTEPFSEAEVINSLQSLSNENLESDVESQFLLQAERMAFGFHGNYPNDRNSWGTYYGPMIVSQDEKGQWFESPSIKLVTPEMLAYWLRRAKSVNHPLLRLRYADLVWDFTYKVTNSHPDIKAAYLVIDAAITLVQSKRYDHEIWAIEKLERSLSIALHVNDKKRIEAVKNVMLALEDEIGEDGKPGLWGTSYDNLFVNKKIALTEDEKVKIITDLESRLTRLVEGVEEHGYVHAVEAAAMRLARYYQTIGQLEDMRRILREYGSAVIITANKAGAIAGLAHLLQLHQIYYNHGLREDADKLTALIDEMGKRTEAEMHEFSHTIEIPTEQIEKYFDELTQGSLEETLTRIAIHFIPKAKETEEQVRDLAMRAPLTFFATRSFLDSSGRPLAQIGSIEEDFEGHVILQLSQNMEIGMPFLQGAIKRMQEKFGPSLETLLDYMYQSPVFQPAYKNLVAQGLDAYLHDDHIAASHILIPQIENALRYLLQKSGGPIYKPNRMGGLALRILDEILRDERVVNALTENVAKYLRVLLVDQRGWNVRNKLSHGMMQPEHFSFAVTDRLFHVLLFLALLREKGTENADGC